MNEKLVSIIIPIYNVEKYLNECLNSIVCQTYNNIEILLIDDGSIDNSGNICDEFEKKDKRIKTFHLKNSGVSSARNFGLKKANGKYILFVDADDYVDNNYVKTIINNLETNDMVACGYYLKFKNNIFDHSISNTNYSIDSSFANKLLFDYNSYRGFLWNKAFKHNIIKDNNIMFDTNIHVCEDLFFVINYLSYCQKVYVIKDCLYYYRMRKSSVTSDYNNDKILSIFDAYLNIYNYYKNKQCLYDDFIYNVLWDYYYYKMIIKNKSIFKKYYKKLNIKLLKKKIFASKDITIFNKIKIFIVSNFSFIYRIKNYFNKNKCVFFD